MAFMKTTGDVYIQTDGTQKRCRCFEHDELLAVVGNAVGAVVEVRRAADVRIGQHLLVLSSTEEGASIERREIVGVSDYPPKLDPKDLDLDDSHPPSDLHDIEKRFRGLSKAYGKVADDYRDLICRLYGKRSP